MSQPTEKRWAADAFSGDRMLFLKGVTPGILTTLQWMRPNPGVYGKAKLTQQVIRKKKEKQHSRRGEQEAHGGVREAESGMIKTHVLNSEIINKIFTKAYIYVSKFILYLIHTLSLYTSIFVLSEKKSSLLT